MKKKKSFSFFRIWNDLSNSYHIPLFVGVVQYVLMFYDSTYESSNAVWMSYRNEVSFNTEEKRQNR